MSITKRHLFLDLEDTIITPVMNGWFDTHLINIPKIKNILNEFKPDEIHIFSFAIHDLNELQKFNLGTRPIIEAALGKTFSAVPTVDDDIIPVCCNIKGLTRQTVDFAECSNFWGKHESFRLNVRHLFKTNWSNWKIKTEIIFLDDAVWDENFHWPDLQVSGKIMNIDNLPD